jgi:uncharacterized protein YndB with AHSA1/START domain
MINIAVEVNAPIAEVWNRWVSVEDVENWAFASDDWKSEGIENNVKVGGKFKAKHYAVDGSAEFELGWTYDNVDHRKFLAYTMDDGRKVEVNFSQTEQGTLINQSFEPEPDNPEEQQRAGWQAFLDNFKKFVESF